MNRGKHLVLLISSLIFVAICFIVMNLSSDLQNYEVCEIDVSSAFTYDSFGDDTKNSANINFNCDTDEKIIQIINKGENYDDAAFFFSLPIINYDIDRVKEIFGDKAKDNKDYLDALEKGPWNGKILFSLSAKDNEDAKNTYTIEYNNGKQQTAKVYNTEDSKYNETDTFKIEKKNDEAVRIILGSKFGGSLEEGEYVLKVKILLISLYTDKSAESEVPNLSIIDHVKLFFTRIINSFKNKGFKGIFNINSIWQLYKTIVLVGLVFYLWIDVRSAYQLGKIIDIYGMNEGLYTFKDVILNGQYAGDLGDGSFNKPIIGILAMIASYAILVVTLPLRVIILIFKDLIGIFAGSEAAEKIPVWGNLLGSFGAYFVVLGFYLMFTFVFWIGAIFVILGALLLFFGHKVTKNNCYLW